MKIAATDIIAIERVMSDLWGSEVTAETFHAWRLARMSDILDGRIATKVAIQSMPAVEVDTAAEEL